MRARALPLPAIRIIHKPRVSQRQLARKTGIGSFRIWQIENGEGPPISTTEKAAIAAALDVKLSDIDWPEVAQRVSA